MASLSPTRRAVKIRIHGGTARHDEPSLCLTCRSAKVMQGQGTKDELVYCDEVAKQIAFKVTSCSQYVHRKHPTLWHMEDIAWILRTNPKTKRIGFVKSQDLKPELRHVLFEEE